MWAQPSQFSAAATVTSLNARLARAVNCRLALGLVSLRSTSTQRMQRACIDQCSISASAWLMARLAVQRCGSCGGHDALVAGSRMAPNPKLLAPKLQLSCRALPNNRLAVGGTAPKAGAAVPGVACARVQGTRSDRDEGHERDARGNPSCNASGINFVLGHP